MKILINTSNLYLGGGVQVALSFITELINLSKRHSYFILTSKVIERQINKDIFPNNFNFYLIESSPSGLKTRNKIINQLNYIEGQINPDIVFSIFGPSYWKPKSKHLIGFADGWLYNPNSVAYNKLTKIKRYKTKLLNLYKSFYLKRDADYYLVETLDAKEKFSKVLNIKMDKIYVIGNTYSAVFKEKEYLNNSNKFFIKLKERKTEEFRLVYIAHNHPNKNLKIIIEVLKYLNNKNIIFYLTLDEVSFNSEFKGYSNIINLGPVPLASCPSIYYQCDALFAPTLLETFSSAYPEAMQMNKPILTSNFKFAKDICEDAAVYFNPLDGKEIANKINVLVNDKILQNKLISKGRNVLKKFETSYSKSEKYIKLCEKIINKERRN